MSRYTVLYRLWYPGLILWPVHSWKTRAGKHSLAPDSGKESHGRSAKGEEVRVVSAVTVQTWPSSLRASPSSLALRRCCSRHFRFPLPVLLSLLLILKPVLAINISCLYCLPHYENDVFIPRKYPLHRLAPSWNWRFVWHLYVGYQSFSWWVEAGCPYGKQTVKSAVH